MPPKKQPIPIPQQQIPITTQQSIPIPIPITTQQPIPIPITTKKQLKTTTTNQQATMTNQQATMTNQQATTTNQQHTSITSVNTTNSISSGDEYYFIIMDYTAALEKLQQTFNNFQNECRKYNIYYVRMYNHIFFTI